MSTSSSMSSSFPKKRGSTDSRKNSGKNPRINGIITPPTTSTSTMGSYMAEKNRKLRVQFDADASNSCIGNGIFHGVSIFVDGFTVPSSQELRRFMLKHGGRYENYFSKKKVSHIICSNLPISKLKNRRSFSRGLPIVKPKWIVDSIEANKLLNWAPYQLDDFLSDSCKQQKLPSFFCLKNTSSFTSTEAPVEIDENSETSTSIFENKGDIHIEADSGIMNSKSQCSEDALFTRWGSFSKSRNGGLDILDDQNDSTQDLGLNIHRSSNTSQDSVQQHSTLEDSNFVENYFKKSRLHFIGTWRNRYRKRFPKKSKENTVKPFSSGKRAIIHIDMDCFFVSVIVRNYPALVDKPVAVCHSDNPKGTAEISSANYPARNYGIKAGMFVRDAMTLCPQLLIFPYNFEAYEEVADQFYDILHKHCGSVQAVSCDEAFLDVTDTDYDPEMVASTIRQEIVQMTRCTCSAGIAENLVLARLATRSAKPNGQVSVPSQKVDDYMKSLSICALPGIGRALQQKLKAQNISTCGQLQLFSKEKLQKDFGMQIGDRLWNYCRGIDNRMVEEVQETKSIGAEVNWGVRFNNTNDCENFLMNLCKEVSSRLHECGVQGRTMTLKVKKRKEGANEPVKYMGHGDCISMSRSMTVPMATYNVNILLRISKQLFGSFHLDVKEVRGIGLQVSRLERNNINEHGFHVNTLESWLKSTSESKRKSGREDVSLVKENNRDILKTGSCSSTFKFPPVCHLDMDVVKHLPSEIFTEINEMYNGELSCLLKSHLERKYVDGHVETNESSSPSDNNRRSESVRSVDIGVNICQESITKDKGKNVISPPFCPTRVSVENKHDEDKASDLHVVCRPFGRFADFISGSISQVDVSVLQQLPEEVKADIFGALPAHRGLSKHSINKTNLWKGDPPRWVHEFQVSNLLILNRFAESHSKHENVGYLSSILQRVTSLFPASLDPNEEEWDEASSIICALVIQYIDLKIKSDIEELYICFRLLGRLAVRSNFFLHVHDKVLPSIQASVSDIYGGKLRLSLVN